MKRILLVYSPNLEITQPYDSKRVIRKKNITIIKDGNLMNSKFISTLDQNSITWKMMMEEWEVFNQNKLQICMDLKQNPIQPVHTINEPKEDGIKALFQQEKMLVLSIVNDEICITKYKLDEFKMKHYIMLKQPFTTWDDVPDEWKNTINIIKENINKVKNTNDYSLPIYSA